MLKVLWKEYGLSGYACCVSTGRRPVGHIKVGRIQSKASTRSVLKACWLLDVRISGNSYVCDHLNPESIACYFECHTMEFVTVTGAATKPQKRCRCYVSKERITANFLSNQRSGSNIKDTNRYEWKINEEWMIIQLHLYVSITRTFCHRSTIQNLLFRGTS